MGRKSRTSNKTFARQRRRIDESLDVSSKCAHKIDLHEPVVEVGLGVEKPDLIMFTHAIHQFAFCLRARLLSLPSLCRTTNNWKIVEEN